MKTLLNLAYENLFTILGGHGISINIHRCQSIHVLKSAKKPKLLLGTVCTYLPKVVCMSSGDLLI
jgi:hypothetical protein